MIPLLDTHQHLIYSDRFSYPWLAHFPALNHAFTLEDYRALTEGAGIEASLFMEVDVAESDMAEEAGFFMEAAASGAHSLSGVIASGRPENADFGDYLDRISTPSLKGIRRVLHVVEDDVSRAAIFRQNIQRLGARDLPFDLCVFPPQHDVGRELVDSCPQTRFVLDHCGNPNISEPSLFPAWQKSIQQFAERDNVYAKLSGIVASGPANEVTLEHIRPYLDTTLEAFGPQRLIWGSDWPVCTLTTSLPDWIGLFRTWLSALSEDEQNAIGHLNAKQLYHM